MIAIIPLTTAHGIMFVALPCCMVCNSVPKKIFILKKTLAQECFFFAINQI